MEIIYFSFYLKVGKKIRKKEEVWSNKGEEAESTVHAAQYGYLFVAFTIIPLFIFKNVYILPSLAL